MRWSPAAVAEATRGELSWRDGAARSGEEAVIGAIGIDTRTLAPDSLFVAVEADRDGHDFVYAAVEAGATAVLVRRPEAVPPGGYPLAVITVADTGRALLDLGRAARARLAGPVAAITGSVGKTSTKDMAAAALRSTFVTLASEKSFNNELGVPLTLVNAPEGTEVAVLEMGARRPDHIAVLCRCAAPTVGVVTAVAAAHVELFGSIEEIALAKGELVEALPPSGFAVLNADDPRVAAMSSRTEASVVSYSVTPSAADVVAEAIDVDRDLRPRFTVRSPWGDARVRLEARGVHQVGNSLAALSIACLCGVGLEAAAAALGEARLSPWRMEVTRIPNGAVVLNDAYNANPASMTAALESLAAIPAERRVAVVGVMAELGPSSRQEHRSIVDIATRLGVELIVVGTAEYGIAGVAGIDEAMERLGPLGEGDAVLVKASRVAGLEELAARLIEVGQRKRP